MPRTSARNAKIALDHAFGETMEQLAIREHLSTARIGQIVYSVCFRVGMSSAWARMQPNLLRERLRPTDMSYTADSPEAFFHELLREPRERAC